MKPTTVEKRSQSTALLRKNRTGARVDASMAARSIAALRAAADSETAGVTRPADAGEGARTAVIAESLVFAAERLSVAAAQAAPKQGREPPAFQQARLAARLHSLMELALVMQVESAQTRAESQAREGLPARAREGSRLAAELRERVEEPQDLAAESEELVVR